MRTGALRLVKASLLELSKPRGVHTRPLMLCLLVGFYLFWAVYLSVTDSWISVLGSWPIALSMALGSFVAGSTPMGGGTVGFPVLVLFFDYPPRLGRDFSFAIQSVGMVSASLFILLRRQTVQWRMLRAALVGALLGTPLGLQKVAPYVPPVAMKVIFATIWASFGVFHLIKLQQLTSIEGRPFLKKRLEYGVGFFVGFLGGALVASVTGVGIDMMLYIVMVAFCRVDLKVAIPTSVLLMAFTSMVGFATQVLTGRLASGLSLHWLAAAPVVLVGAPLGASIVCHVDRRVILVVVSVLCLAQFIWTMIHEAELLGRVGVSLSLLGVLAVGFLFLVLYRVGERLWPDAQRDAPVVASLVTQTSLLHRQ